MELKTYRITLQGCDDHTRFELVLPVEALGLLSALASAASANSTYGCQPVFQFEEIDNGF